MVFEVPTVSFQGEDGQTYTYEESEFTLITDFTEVTDRDLIFKTLRENDDLVIQTILALRGDKQITPPAVTSSSTSSSTTTTPGKTSVKTTETTTTKTGGSSSGSDDGDGKEGAATPAAEKTANASEEGDGSSPQDADEGRPSNKGGAKEVNDHNFATLAKSYNEKYRELIAATLEEKKKEEEEGADGNLPPPKPCIGFGLMEDMATGLVSVSYVYEDGPADQVGIKPGVLIRSIGGEKITTLDEVATAIGVHCHAKEFTPIEISSAPPEEEAESEEPPQLPDDIRTVDLWIMTADGHYEGKPYYFDKEHTRRIE